MDTTLTQKSASYLDLYLVIDNGGRLKTKLYDKRDDFTFPILSFPFISSNIPASQAYGVYISELIHNSIACAQYNNFQDRAEAAKAKAAQTWLRCSYGVVIAVKHGYVAPMV